jgi:hypothetical protein
VGLRRSREPDSRSKYAEQRMDDLLKWATQYSPPVLVFISLGAALLYMVKAAVDQSVSAGFNRYRKEVELRLQRRSNFEERVLLDRYMAIRDLQLRLEKVMTDLNRQRHGQEVAGLVENGEVVRLTEAFELLNVNKMLLTQKFYNLFLSKAQLALRFANERGTTRPGDSFRAACRTRSSADAGNEQRLRAGPNHLGEPRMSFLAHADHPRLYTSSKRTMSSSPR